MFGEAWRQKSGDAPLSRYEGPVRSVRQLGAEGRIKTAPDSKESSKVRKMINPALRLG